MRFCSNLYNLLWLAVPSFGSLSTFMSNFSSQLKLNNSSEELLDVYYKNKDLRLLLDFFSISSGIAPSIGILAALDNVGKLLQATVTITQRISRALCLG